MADVTDVLLFIPGGGDENGVVAVVEEVLVVVLGVFLLGTVIDGMG